MAITKQVKVTFNATAVINSEMEAAMGEYVKELANKAGRRGEKLTGREEHILVTALTHGPEGLVEFFLKQSLRDMVAHATDEYSDGDMYRFAPAKVEVIR